MRVTEIARRDFIDLVYSRTGEFMERINCPEAFVVKSFYDSNRIQDFRKAAFQAGLTSDASWHPLHDDCPDYHRLHDNYRKAHVKQKMHAFYYHNWYPRNQDKFDFFSDIFSIKNFVAGFPEKEFLGNIPSDGFIARVNIHHYPKGGGYQAEHIDPVGKHAQIQTLVAASEFGKDYSKGGVFARSAPGAEKTYADPYMKPGDMLVMSPGIRHGVEAVDPDLPYEWRTNDGRWMILPLIVGSDYANPDVTKPVQVGDAAT
jgi:hypothetical protein